MKWYWVYDGPGVRDFATGIAVDGGGNGYVTGSSQGAGGTVAAATAKLNRLGASVWLKRLQYGDEGHCGRRPPSCIAGSAAPAGSSSPARLIGLMATRQNLLIAEVSADTGARVHHAVVDGSDPDDGDGADDGGTALAVDASGNAFAAGWTTDVTSGVVHAFVARMSADGAVPWSKPMWLSPGDNEAYFETIDLDAAGNVVCGGYSVQPGLGPEGLVESFCPPAASAGPTCPAAPPPPWTSAGP